MMILFKRVIPVVLAIIFGLAALVGLLVVPPLADLILSWVAFLAAIALLLGIINLFIVHIRRAVRGSGYSIVLLLSMIAVFALAVTDALGFTVGGVEAAFSQLQAPLEAAVASLLAFFLLFAGARLLQQRRNIWSILFLISALFFLITQGLLPTTIATALTPVRSFADSVLVTAGVRGILLGVALGIIMLSLRLLAGLERPYSP